MFLRLAPRINTVKVLTVRTCTMLAPKITPHAARRLRLRHAASLASLLIGQDQET